MRSHFDLNPNLLYLNSANLSFTPRKVNEAVERYRAEFEENPTVGLDKAWERLWSVQTALSHFLGGDVTDLFLRSNVTQVLNALIFGVPLSAGNEILVGEHEYGSIINICRLRCEQQSLGLRLLKMPASAPAFQSLSDEGFVELLLSQLSPQTKMVVMSHVIAGSGYVVPISLVGKELERRDISFIVDGAYAPGALPVNFSDLAMVSAYGCSLYKWMLGPKGTAFGWVNPRLQEKLLPVTAGWTTFESFGPFAKFGGNSRFQERFSLSGCHDFSVFFAISDLLDWWNEREPKKIRQRMVELRKELCEKFRELPEWSWLLNERQRELSPMLTFKVPPRMQSQGAQLKSHLLDKYALQVHTYSLRGEWYLTLSPHVYNTVDEFSLVVQKFKLVWG